MKCKETFLQRLANNLKFRHKITLVSTFVAFFVGVASILGYQVSIAQYNELLYQQTSSSIELLGRQIHNEMESIEELSNMVTVNPGNQNDLYLLSQPKVDSIARYRARYDITQRLYQYLEPAVVCITILLGDNSLIACGLDSSPEQQHVIDFIKYNSTLKNGAGFWTINDRNDGTVLYVREIRKTNEPNFLQSMGYLMFRVDFDKLVKQSRPDVSIDSEKLLVVEDNQNNVFYSSNDLNGINIDPLQLIKKGDYSICEIDDTRLFVCRMSLNTKPSLNIVTGLDYNDIFKSANQTQVATIVTMVIAIVLAIVYASMAVRSINSRFELLIKKMNRFKSGKLELLESHMAYGNDELGLLNKYFDEVTIELKNIIEDNYIKELLITRSQLENLEQQIHPHFLYNTLDTINWFAKRSGEKHIPKIVEALSVLLRSNLSEKEDVVTLEKELTILKSYITIQKIRYTDMLNIDFMIDPETLDVLIPKLSIQPLVENAIYYSLEESIEGCQITISSRIEGNEVIVAVENNGSQIDEDILYKLHNKVIQPNGHGIGLVNIDSRLKIIFGDLYGLRFINAEDSVTVEIHLPFDPAKNKKNEG